MISRIPLSVIVFIAATVWIALLIIDGVTVELRWLRYLSPVISILLFLLGAFDIWLWRLPFLRNWLVNRPDIRGTWRVIIQSDWRDPSTGEMIDLIEGYMAVHQTFSLLSMRLMTSESTSDLLGSEIIRLPDRAFRVAAVYRNEPDILVRDRSPIHNGAFLLHVVGTPVTALNGHYWTDRGTRGHLRTTDRRKKVLRDFQVACRAFNPENTERRDSK